jgi:hypothetical protein
MHRYGALALMSAILWSSLGMAQDRLNVVGELDLRWVDATGPTSYLYGGLGALRFDSEHDGLRLGYAMLASQFRFTDILSAHVVAYAYDDHDRNFVDLTEAYLEARPYPTRSIRWSARAGAFFMPVSLENRGPGWTDVYTITPSALNTWLGEEFRTIGTQFEARWLGASHGYVGDVALVAALYAWNEPAGALLADRGFALTDRPSTLFGGLGMPPMTFYHQVDHNPGYYGGLTWRHHDILEIRALHYDNRADPGAQTGTAYAWRTRFSTAGARLEPTAAWTFLVQYLDGDTEVGPNEDFDAQFKMTYRTVFALTSFEWQRERFTARFDDFLTNQVNGFYGPAADEVGHAWTFGWMHDLGAGWHLAAEWIRVTSRFPPRIEYDESSGLIESQVQLAIRYRFHLGV